MKSYERLKIDEISLENGTILAHGFQYHRGKLTSWGHHRETTGGLTTWRAFWQNHQGPLNTGGNWRRSLQEQFINGTLSRRHWGDRPGELPGSTDWTLGKLVGPPGANDHRGETSVPRWLRKPCFQALLALKWLFFFAISEIKKIIFIFSSKFVIKTCWWRP